MRTARDDKVMQIGVWGRYLDHWGLLRRTTVFEHQEIREVTSLDHRAGASRDIHDPSYKMLPLPA